MALGGAGLLASGDPLLFPCPSTAECRAPHAPLQMGTAEGALGRGRCHRGLGPTRKREQRAHSTGRVERGAGAGGGTGVSF